MKLVVDTNCLLVSIYKFSDFHWFFDLFRKQKFTLCFTTEILLEYYEVISKYYSVNLAEAIINEILNSSNIENTIVYYKWELIKTDLDDNKFVDCAISSNSNYIITHDKHFDILNKIDFPKVICLKLSEFKNKIFIN